MEACPKQNIILSWLTWHFFETPKGILNAFKNFLIFNFNYFSIPFHFKTLFSHWRRYKEFYSKNIVDIKQNFKTLTFNLISRVLGAIVRLITILIGVAAEIFIFIIGFISVIGWLLSPIFLIVLIWFLIYLI